MIKRHHKIHYLRKELASTSATRWLAQAPGEMADGFLCNPAALASWVAARKPDLLKKPAVGVLVLGSMLDAFDDGSWWSVFAAMLDKGTAWAKVTVLVPEVDGAIKRSGFVPASLAKSVRILRGNLSDLKNMPPEGIDIIYLPFAYLDSWCPLLGYEGRSLWPFLDANAVFVGGLLETTDVPLCMEVATQYGLDSQWTPNRFYGPTSQLMAQAPVLVSAHGTKPQDLASAHDHATNLTEVQGVIKELCTATPGGEPEDYRLWGLRSSIRSSLDALDHYISLPRGLAARVSNGEIYPIENDLAAGEPFRCVIPPENMADGPGIGAHWTKGVFWAGRVWEGGLGNAYNNTFGSALDSMGVKSSHITDVIDVIFGDTAPEQTQVLKDALTGGELYAPSREERLLFDLVDRRESQEIIALVTKNKELLDAFNEDRLPLLVMLGLRDLPEVMRQVIALGANPQAVDGGSRPILVELARRANRDAVQVVLNAGAPVNCQDPLGWTPLLTALLAQKWGVVMLLLDFGADSKQSNSFGVSPATIASGKKTEMDLMAGKAMAAMKDILDFDIAKALKKAGQITEAGDIPPEIRERILAGG